MRKILFLISVSAVIFTLSGCAALEQFEQKLAPQPQLTSLQRRVMEAKELEGTFDDAFKATIAVLQDKGYMIKTSDFTGGIIYAETSSGTFVPFQSSSAYKATVNFEKFTNDRTKIRISLYRDTYDGFSGVQGGPVQDPQIYQDLYAEIQKEMFRRAQLNK